MSWAFDGNAKIFLLSLIFAYGGRELWEAVVTVCYND